MQKIYIYFVTVFFALCSFAEVKTQDGYTLRLKASKDGSTYKKGETVEFLLTAEKDSMPVKNLKVNFSVMKDGCKPMKQEDTTLKSGKARSLGSLNEAGFLMCKASVYLPENDGKENVVNLYAGAAIDPLEISQSQAVPETFDAFWKAQKAILAEIPMDLKLTPVNSSDESVALFDIEARSSGKFLRGYLAYPKNAKPKSLPAILTLHGAGVYSSSLGRAVSWAKRGFIGFDFNVHGILNGQPKEYYAELKKEIDGYQLKNSRDKEKVFFKDMFLLDLRAVDVIASLPEWDGKNLVAYGGSQGGGQALALGGLSDKVSLVVSMYPAICDHSGPAVGRTSGWPHFTRMDDSEIFREMAYVDGVNFATRIKVPVLFMINYADNVCEPTSCYAAYNVIKSPKELIINEESRHTPTKESVKKIEDLIVERVKSRRANSN